MTQTRGRLDPEFVTQNCRELPILPERHAQVAFGKVRGNDESCAVRKESFATKPRSRHLTLQALARHHLEYVNGDG